MNKINTHTVMYIPPALLSKLNEIAEYYGLSRQQTLNLLLKQEGIKNEIKR